MSAFLGALSAISIGLTDISGRRITAQTSPMTAASSLQIVAIFGGLALVPFIDSEYLWGDVGLGALSGLGMAGGLACYYTSMHRVGPAVTAPITATLAALLPFVYAIVLGGRPGVLGVVGAAIAIAGVALVSADPTATIEGFSGGVRWAVLSGICYGFGLGVVLHVSEDSGAWPVASQRLMAFILLAALAVWMGLPAVPPAGLRVAAALGGAFAAAASIFYLAGIYIDAPPAIVTSAMFPAASVIVGRIFYQDVILRRHIIGTAVSLIGIAAVVTA